MVAPPPRRTPEYWRKRAFTIAQEYGVDPYGFVRLINRESGFSTETTYGPGVSSAGAQGIAQFMPDTAKAYNIDPWDPEQALRGSARYLHDIGAGLDTKDWRLLALGYTHGQGGAQSLIDQWGEDWFSHVAGDYQDYIDYVAQGPGRELSLSRRQQEAYRRTPLGGTSVSRLPGDPFQDIPEYFAGYKRMLRDTLERVELSRTSLMAMDAPYEQSKRTYLGDPTKPGEPSRTEIREYLQGEGFNPDQISKILPGNWRIGTQTSWMQEIGGAIASWLKPGDEDLPSYAEVVRKVKEASRNEVIAQSSAYLDAWSNFQHQQTLQAIILWLPLAMTQGKVSTLQDVEEEFFGQFMHGPWAPDATVPKLSQEDKEWVSELIANLSPALDLQPDASSSDVVRALTEEIRPHPVVLASLTTEQLVRVFTAQAGPVSPPLGMDDESLRDVLRGIEMTDEEYQEAIAGVEAASEELIADYYNMYVNTEALKAGIRVPEIPSLSITQKLKIAALQPALAGAELANIYREKFAMPLVAWELIHLSRATKAVGMGPLKGIEDMEDLYNASRTEGEGIWESYKNAYEDWDRPWPLELALEVGLDPTTYFGFGLIIKASRTFRFLRPLAALESGWIKATDAPFAALKSAYKKVPMTIDQGAGKAGRDFYRLYNSTFASRTGIMTGVRGAKVETMQEVMAEAVKEYVQHPVAPTGKLGNLGASAVSATKRPVAMDDVAAWSKRLKGKNPITRQLVQNVNEVYESLLSSGTHGFLTHDTAAPLLLRIIGAEDTFLKTAKGLLQSRLDQDMRGLFRLFVGEDWSKVMTNVSKAIKSTYVSNAKSDVWKFSEQMGMSMAGRRVSAVMDWTPLLALDRFAVQPMARLYLHFFSYGPWNIAETYFRVGRGGGGWSFGYLKYIDDVVKDGYGYLRNFPDDARHGGPHHEVYIVPEEGVTSYGEKKPGLIPLITREAPIGRIPYLQKIPRQYWSIQNFSDHTARTSQHMRMTYIYNKMADNLADVAPEYTKLLGEITGNIHKAGLPFERKELDELGKRVFTAAVHSPDSVRGLRLTPDKLQARKYLSEIAGLFDQYQQIDAPFQNAILRAAESGELIQDIDGFMARTFDAMRDDYLNRLPARTEGLRRFLKELGDTPITTPEEAKRTLRALFDTQEAVGEAIEHHRAITTERAHGLRTLEGDKLHTLAHTEMSEFFSALEENYARVADGLRAHITQMAEGVERRDLLSLMDNLQNQFELLVETRSAERRIIDEGIAAAPHRGAADWDGTINPKRHELWLEHSTRMDDMRIEAEALARLGAEAPSGAIDQVVGDLAPVHIARLFATTSDDVSRGFTYTEAMSTLMSKRRFVGHVNVKASVLAREMGKTAEEMGFSKEAIERVYDQIIAKLRLDPSIGGTMEPLRQVFEGLRHDIHGITSTRVLPEGTAGKWNTYLDNVAGQLEETPMFGAVKPSRLRKMPTPEGKDEGISQWIGDYSSKDRTYRIVVFRDEGDFEHIAQISWLEGQGKGAGRLDDVADEIAEDLRRLGFTDVSFETVDLGRRAGRGRMFERMVERVKSRMGDAPPPKAEVTAEWSTMREEAMDRTRMSYELDFTDYSSDNMFDAAMKRIMPFWTYESQRWPYLARASIQTPGVFTTWGKYMDYSDTGYINVPGTDFQLNPFRGTIFMGGMRRFYIKDYPEYYDRFPGFSQTMDYAGKAGFFPGIHIALPVATFGALTGKAQWGELLPSFAKTGLGALVGAGVPGAQALQETMFPERFRNYEIARRISWMAQDRGLDYNGLTIWNKIVEDITLTPDEQRLWDEASRYVGRKAILFEQTGLFRMRSEESIQAWKEAAELYENLTGIPVEQQEIMRQREQATGERFTDLFPLDPLDQEKLNQLEATKYWAGVTRPLLPSAYQKVAARIGEFWETVSTDIWDKARTGDSDGIAFKEGGKEYLSTNKLHELFVAGDISNKDYSRMLGETTAQAVAMTEGLGKSEYFKDVPKTLDDRVAFAEEHNLPTPTFHPGQELTWLYYDLTPQLRQDEEGNYYYDYATYFGQVDAILSAMPDAVKSRFLEYIRRNWTPSQHLHSDVSREYLMPYRNLREGVIQQFTPEQQRTLRTYVRAEGPERERLKLIEFDKDERLISKFEGDLRTARANLRAMDPTLDAWLYFWGRTTTFTTKEAQTIYLGLMRQYRPEALEKMGPFPEVGN